MKEVFYKKLLKYVVGNEVAYFSLKLRVGQEDISYLSSTG